MRNIRWEALVPAALAAGFLGWMITGTTGCELIAAVDRTKINQNAGGAGGIGGFGGSVGGNEGGGGNIGGGGNPGCVDEDCPGAVEDCRAPGCVGDTCGFINAALGTACTDGATAEADVCDGDGNCVQCNAATDCDFDVNLTICSNGLCVNAACDNGTIDGNETGDDDGAGLECGGDVCGPCVNDEGCNAADDCLSSFCDESGAGGGGGSAPAGICSACAGDGDCLVVADQYCNAGVCDPDKAQAEACGLDAVGNANDECLSGSCADGVCCNEACGAICEACSATLSVGANGVCSAIDSANDPDPDGNCNASAANCTTANCSNTRGFCGNPGSGTTCHNGTDDPNMTGFTCNSDKVCDGVLGNGCPAPDNNGGVTCFTAGMGATSVDCTTTQVCPANDTDPCPNPFAASGALCADALSPNPDEPDCNPTDRCNATGVCNDGTPAGVGLGCDDNGGSECDGNDPGLCITPSTGGGGGTGGAGGAGGS